MLIYTIIGGVNGVGKSSLIGVLKSERRDLGHIIDVDKTASEKSINSLDAGRIALKRVKDYLCKGISFTQETTLSGQYVEKTAKNAKGEGYYIRLFYIGLNTLDESKNRIKNRVDKGGHNISEEDVNRMFHNRFESLKKVLPYCDEVHLYDNENGFVEVGEYKNGEIIIKGDYFPKWLKELKVSLDYI